LQQTGVFLFVSKHPCSYNIQNKSKTKAETSSILNLSWSQKKLFFSSKLILILLPWCFHQSLKTTAYIFW